MSNLDEARIEIFNNSMKIAKDLNAKLSKYDYKKYILEDSEHFVTTTLFVCMYFFEMKLVKQNFSQDKIVKLNNSLIEEMNNRLTNPDITKTRELFFKIRRAMEDFAEKEDIDPIEAAIIFYLLEASHYKFDGSVYNDKEYKEVIKIVGETFTGLLRDIVTNGKDELFLSTEYFFSVIIKSYLSIEKQSRPNGIFETIFKKIDYGKVAESYRELQRASDDLGKKIYNNLIKKYTNDKLVNLLMVTNESLQELLDINIVLNMRLNDKAKGLEFTREEYDRIVLDAERARDVVQEKLETLNIEFNRYGEKNNLR